jgi:hypothetical protein
MNKKTIDALYADFDKIEERRGLGGKTFKYLKPAPVIHRLNKVFGLLWSYEVVEREVLEDWVVAKVRIYVWDDTKTDRQIWREAYGSASLERYSAGKNQGKLVDPGNAFKGAVSDAIKKAASTLGVGLHQLYDLDEDTNGLLTDYDLGLEEEKVEQTEQEPQETVDLSDLAEPERKPFDEPEQPTVPDPAEEPAQTANEEEGGITDVQVTAIKKMSEHKNVSIAEFMKRALGEAKELDRLTYDEGILVIREANKAKTPK